MISYGLSICCDQMILDMNTRDIRVKDALVDHEGYIIEKGKGKLSQVLQYEGDEEEEDSL